MYLSAHLAELRSKCFSKRGILVEIGQLFWNTGHGGSLPSRMPLNPVPHTLKLIPYAAACCVSDHELVIRFDHELVISAAYLITSTCPYRQKWISAQVDKQATSGHEVDVNNTHVPPDKPVHQQRARVLRNQRTCTAAQRIHLTQCTNSMVSESQLPNKIVN